LVRSPLPVSERGQLRSSSRFASLFALACSASFGCRSSEARRLEAEVSALSHAIDDLRNAPNAGKATLLEALEKVACERPEACRLKESCVAAYQRHRAGLEASERARALLADKDGGAGAVISAASELNRAQIELEHARTMTDRCSADQGALLRKVRAH
jgi:hypothetical protein